MKLFWRTKVDRERIKHDFDEDQKEAIGGYCFLSFIAGLIIAVCIYDIQQFIKNHVIWVN